MKIGYKGLSKDMTATSGSVKEKFEIGQVYTKILPEDQKLPRLCTADGYHYCNTLEEVFRYYPKQSGNRFFEIEVLGPFNDSHDKSITTSFKLLREIPEEELKTLHYWKEMKLDLVASLQKKYPMLHVGGSVGLFLHGVRLKRMEREGAHDLDFISPYFFLPEEKLPLEGGKEVEVDYLDAKASGNDFDETFIVDGTKIDYRIDPKQRYKIIEYNGFKFKVSDLLTILEAKMKYAKLPNGTKHRDDLIEMVLPASKPTPKVELDLDLPF